MFFELVVEGEQMVCIPNFHVGSVTSVSAVHDVEIARLSDALMMVSAVPCKISTGTSTSCHTFPRFNFCSC
jgi:hypothetical protein